MQFRNLSVARKIWSLLLFVMGALLLTGVVMTSYMKNLESDLRASLEDMEERIRLVVELRGNIQTAASFLVAGNLVQDAESVQFFDGKFKQTVQKTPALMEEIGARLTTPAGREMFQTITKLRDQVNILAEQVGVERRNDGDVAGIVQSQLVPMVDRYVAELNALVQLQEQLRKQNLQDGDQRRNTGYVVGGLVLALVVVLGLLVAVWLVRQLTVPLARAVELAETIAEGDLTRDVHDDRRDELGHLLRSLNTMTQKLRALVGEVRNGVDSVSSAATQIASGNQDLSARTEQTAANLQQTAASIEELSSTVTQSADTARQANQLAGTAVMAAERGGEVVSQVVQSMDQINTSSRKISDIIGVIDGIAFQTNILALNAAVEAARAGEQGRGFAVVAGEVRSLAGRSAEAAKEIKGLITASVSHVEVGAEQVMKAGESMLDIVASVRRVTDLIGEISASSNEQRDGISQVNLAVSNLDQMTQQNAALVEESSAAASSMNDQAQRLTQVIAQFKVSQGVHSAAHALPPRSDASRSAQRPAPAVTKSPAASRSAQRPAISRPAQQPVAKSAVPSVKTASSTPAAQKLAPSPKPVTASDDDWETF